MTARILDGIALRREMTAALRVEVEAASTDGAPPPCLATVVVGDNPRCHILARGKRSAAEEVGMRSVSVDLPASATQEEVEEAITRLGNDPGVHGVFMQLPLPGHLALEPILDFLPPAKDVDAMGSGGLHRPTTPLAVIRLLDRYEFPVDGRSVVVVGRSRGMERTLGDRGAQVTVASDASPIGRIECDILIATASRPESITGRHVRPGAVVVDLTGDVNQAEVEAVADALAPYPTGVGPVVLACLLRNTLDAAMLGP